MAWSGNSDGLGAVTSAGAPLVCRWYGGGGGKGSLLGPLLDPDGRLGLRGGWSLSGLLVLAVCGLLVSFDSSSLLSGLSWGLSSRWALSLAAFSRSLSPRISVSQSWSRVKQPSRKTTADSSFPGGTTFLSDTWSWYALRQGPQLATPLSLTTKWRHLSHTGRGGVPPSPIHPAFLSPNATVKILLTL